MSRLDTPFRNGAISPLSMVDVPPDRLLLPLPIVSTNTTPKNKQLTPACKRREQKPCGRSVLRRKKERVKEKKGEWTLKSVIIGWFPPHLGVIGFASHSNHAHCSQMPCALCAYHC